MSSEHITDVPFCRLAGVKDRLWSLLVESIYTKKLLAKLDCCEEKDFLCSSNIIISSD